MSSSAAIAFLIGLGAQLQVRFVGSMGLSEVVMFLVAPFLFLRDYYLLSRHRFALPLWLLLMCCVGCVIGGLLYHAPRVEIVKGLATPYALFAIIVCLHAVLWRDIGNLKWVVCGLALTIVVNVFIFQETTDIAMWAEGESGLGAVAGIMSSPIFWVCRLTPTLTLPVRCWYLRTPALYSIGSVLFLTCFSLLTSKGSGRSAALCLVASAFLIFYGGKRVVRMQKISRHILTFMIAAFCFLLVFKGIYTFTASRGLLGEEAQAKYLKQTAGGTRSGLLGLLIGGRVEFFVGMYAGLRNPIVGYGPKPVDENHYMEEFLRKYGAEEEHQAHLERMRIIAREYGVVDPHLPTHSHLTMFWNWYGICGLLFWIYVLYQIWLFFRKYVAVIPQWYGYFALGIPASLWAIFFSPFHGRVGMGVLIVALLFVRCVASGRIKMPYSMLSELRYVK